MTIEIIPPPPITWDPRRAIGAGPGAPEKSTYTFTEYILDALDAFAPMAQSAKSRRVHAEIAGALVTVPILLTDDQLRIVRAAVTAFQWTPALGRHLVAFDEALFGKPEGL